MFNFISPKDANITKPPYTTSSNVAWLDNSKTDILDRDKTQSSRLHEPTWRISTTDPMNGKDINSLKPHPKLEDGNLTMYFDGEETKQAYIDMPLDHPNQRLPFAATDEDDRGG
ncbi:MAG: hypothetical protein OQL16_02230 [Gammaproteobacteria bacterium]|nr:hypothetical protein [Gammaproteobacteria bacterium]